VKWLSFIFSLILAFNVRSDPTAPVAVVPNGIPPAGVAISLDKVAIPMFIDLVYTSILDESYVIHDTVLQKKDLVTVRLRPGFSKEDIKRFMVDLLAGYGVRVDGTRGYAYFRPIEDSTPEYRETFIYVPRFRSSSYIMSLLAPVFSSDSFSTKRNVSAAGVSSVNNSSGSNVKSISDSLDIGDKGAGQFIDKETDVLVFIGTLFEIDKFKLLVEKIDQPPRQIHVRAYIYEVSHQKNENSNALKTVLNFMNGKFKLSLGSERSTGNIFSVTLPQLGVVFNAFSNDTRFRVLSSPSVFVRSGESSRFVVGTDTPVLTGVNYTERGGAVQSVQYRKSGVIFEVKPKIYQERIDLEISQQTSNFVATTTGVSDSPTLLTREVSTSLTMQSGQLVVIGGLTERKINHDENYLPFSDYLLGSEETQSNSEVLLFLYCELVKDEQMDKNAFVPPVDLNSFILSLPGKSYPFDGTYSQKTPFSKRAN